MRDGDPVLILALLICLNPLRIGSEDWSWDLADLVISACCGLLKGTPCLSGGGGEEKKFCHWEGGANVKLCAEGVKTPEDGGALLCAIFG